MNLEKLRSMIEAEIQRIDGLPATDWMTGKSVGLVTVLQWLDEPWEPDVELLKKVVEADIDKISNDDDDPGFTKEEKALYEQYATGVVEALDSVLEYLSHPTALLAEAKRLGLKE